jgi:hypothetical protein
MAAAQLRIVAHGMGRMVSRRTASATAGRIVGLLAGVALCAFASAAQAQGQAQGQAVGLRGAEPRPDPRSITVDPRVIPPAPAFETQAPAPIGGAVALPPGADPNAATPASGGPTSRRAASRASRPVQARVTGGAQRSVRPAPNPVSRLPAADPAAQPLRLRPTAGATRIVTPAPDGLQPSPSRRAPRQQEEDPWAPLGLRLGGVTITPSITQWGGYDSNSQRTPTRPRGSPVLRTEGEIGVRSDWSTHALTANLRGGYNFYTRDRDANRPDFTGVAALRLNVTRDTDIDWDLRSGLDSQRPGSPNLNARAIGRPLIYTYGTGLGVTQRFNRFSLNLRGTVDRTSFENGRDSLGFTISQRDRDATQYGVRLRAGYELTPGMTPFVEVAADKRAFDRTVDASGFRRASTGQTARLGTTFEFSRLLTGEVAVGYQARDFEDGRLRSLRGVVGDAALIWTATPLTTVTLRGATELADTTIPGVSGSTNRRFTAEIAHALRRNWIVTGFGGWSRTAFDGNGLVEDTWQLGLRGEYKVTRNLALRASYTYEQLNSTATRADYRANIFLFGLKLAL